LGVDANFHAREPINCEFEEGQIITYNTIVVYLVAAINCEFVGQIIAYNTIVVYLVAAINCEFVGQIITYNTIVVYLVAAILHAVIRMKFKGIGEKSNLFLFVKVPLVYVAKLVIKE